MTKPRVRNIAILLTVALLGAMVGNYATLYRDYLVTTYNYGYSSGYNAAMYRCVFGAPPSEQKEQPLEVL